MQTYGIQGQKAPNFKIGQWVDGQGNEIAPIQLDDYKGKYKVIYCFQSWCSGCHSLGLPALQKLTEALKDRTDIAFLAVQTVFEGFEANTYEKMLETQQKYKLQIPFGHDPGDDTTANRSNLMYHYRTGGTPWFIFIDKEGYVVFNDFHINVENAIAYLNNVD